MPASGRELALPLSPQETQGPAARSFWLRRRPGDEAQQGDMVIQARVRARVLGMQLLTLEAHVVVGTENGQRPVVSPFIRASNEPSAMGHRSGPAELMSSGPQSSFVQAMELLQQGADTLERSRRSRWSRPGDASD